MKNRILFTAITFLMFGCSVDDREYNFKMDYPADAARISLGGEIYVNIDCVNSKANVIYDSSNGVFSRHVNKRLSSICYKKDDKFDVVYRFDPQRGVKQNMIGMHYPGILPASNTDKLSDGDS